MNYIVSGLERSGTSLLMQLLEAGGAPVAYDDSRKANEHNPKGFYELEGGKIINKLIDKTFDFKKYEGKFIKITAYGLRFLPDGDYKILFSERALSEILDSMEKMSTQKFERHETSLLLKKLLGDALTKIMKKGWQVQFIDYNMLMLNPDYELRKIKQFFPDFNIEEAKKVIDKKLYRNRC